MKKEELEKMKVSVMKYVGARMGLFNLESLSKIESDKEKIEVQTDWFKHKKTLGIFKHIIKEFKLTIGFWKDKDSDGDVIWRGNVHFRYNHPSGGSNGCKTDINLKYFPESNLVMEDD